MQRQASGLVNCARAPWLVGPQRKWCFLDCCAGQHPFGHGSRIWPSGCCRGAACPPHSRPAQMKARVELNAERATQLRICLPLLSCFCFVAATSHDAPPSVLPAAPVQFCSRPPFMLLLFAQTNAAMNSIVQKRSCMHGYCWRCLLHLRPCLPQTRSCTVWGFEGFSCN